MPIMVKHKRFSLKYGPVMLLREVEKECLKLEKLCLCSLLGFTCYLEITSVLTQLNRASLGSVSSEQVEAGCACLSLPT